MRFTDILTAAGLALLLTACGASRPLPQVPDNNSAPVSQLTEYPYEGGKLQVKTDKSICSVRLSGAINAYTVNRLRPLLGQLEQAGCATKTMVLDSSNGILGDAITLGAMLKNRGYDTQLQPGSTCNTPCLLVFASGRQRVMPDSLPAAQLAFTQIPPDQDFGQQTCDTELSRGQQLTLARYLRAMLPNDTATAVYQKLQAANCNHTDRYGAASAMAMGLATATR